MSTIDLATAAPDHASETGDVAVALASLHAMAAGTLDEFEELYTPDATNRESVTEPPDTRGTGREGRVAEHWANRDDMGGALQLGWNELPPA